MDYKQEYLKLKQQVLNQKGSGRMNPQLLNQLSNLVFIVGDNVLSDDVNSILMSLIQEFNRISTSDLKHNLELSQYYAVGKGLMRNNGTIQCENCELVLKYIDTSICLSNNKIIRTKDGPSIDCNINRGLVKFFIKQKLGDVYKYTRIRIAKVQSTGTLLPFNDVLYQDNEEINRLDEATNIAINRGQSDIIFNKARRGELNTNTPDALTNTTQNVNQIVSDVKNASISSQISKMNRNRLLSPVPNQTSVNVANTVAQHINNNNPHSNMSVVLVPGGESLPLQSDNRVQSTIGSVNDNGISITSDKNTVNTLNAKAVNSRASMAVDANLALIPKENIVNSNDINVAQPNNSSKTSIPNKLSNDFKSIIDKTGDVTSKAVDNTKGIASNLGDDTKNLLSNAYKKLEEAASKFTDLFKNSNKSTVVPVSQDLSVLTSNPVQTAGQVPVPTNNHYNHTSNNINKSNSNFSMNNTKSDIATINNNKSKIRQSGSVNNSINNSVRNTNNFKIRNSEIINSATVDKHSVLSIDNNQSALTSDYYPNLPELSLTSDKSKSRVNRNKVLY
ncbi:hypothetical protein QLL95_gp0771 [Cotonvirus japonicus]|uniref:Uncharacterized protein n=1 Tax=Cotonvirus japonicus TaxID=2811091 RepID=A0ABM7NT56_9VIRU|nr:hypothetical protein QLL95_gp0771 [Cotonvirus japonicus]BCS83352.1 hypothetical protein [Cotonvirus japonicus]